MNHKHSYWYKDFFTKFYLPYFSGRDTKEKIKREVKFISDTLTLPYGAHVLDLACGTGRHAVKLAKQGFVVTGLDFNNEFLKLARQASKKNGVQLKLVQGDMRSLPFRNKFESVICMYTSFGYFNDNGNLQTLKSISYSLKQSGYLLLDLPNKYWTTHKIAKKKINTIGSASVLEVRSFDKNRNLLKNKIIILERDRNKTRQVSISTFLRLYDLKEIQGELKKVNLRIIKVFGDYNLKNIFHSKTSLRMIILAKKE
jgi:ubiquinone/menaquinone biosynthesis C-methylase UbiE